jgi:group I intron endonuclease
MVQSRKKKEEHLATLITENQFNFPTTLISGIYAIFCISTNKVYFGKSVNVRGRMLKHKRCLRQGIHINKRLLRAFRKYGESQFIFCLVESVVPELLSKRERHYIMHYKSFRDYYGFNIKKVL